MRVWVLAAWILVTLSAIAPIATEAGETWEARLRSEQVTVDDADVTTTNTKDLREHILHHVLDQDPRVMSGEWVATPSPMPNGCWTWTTTPTERRHLPTRSPRPRLNAHPRTRSNS